MKLLNLRLENFKGIKSLNLNLDGKSASIYGTNATGKTTIADAVSWLLFDKPSTEEKSFSPKPRGRNGEEIHHVDSVVEGIFLTDVGVITLRKTYRENWVKKRGSVTETFSGHVTEYAIDEVATSKSQFTDRLEEILPRYDLAPAMLNPMYFPETMDWRQRRLLLLDICGDVSTEEVLDGDPELSELKELLRKPGAEDQLYTVDEYRQIAKAQQKKLNDRLRELPARIDEAKNSMPDVDERQEENLRYARSRYEKAIKDKQEELAALKASGPALQIRQKIQELKMQLTQAAMEYRQRYSEEHAGEVQAIAELNGEILKLKYSADSSKLKTLEDRLASMRERRQQLTDDYMAAKAEAYDGDGICPTCKQPLPAEMLETAIANFNLRKSKRLEDIRRRVEERCSKTMIEAAEQEIQAYKDKAQQAAGQIQELQSRLDAMRSAQTQPEPFEATGTYVSIQAQIKSLEDERADADGLLTDEVGKLQGTINVDQKQLDDINRSLALLSARRSQIARIQQLESELAECGKAYESYMHGLDLCDIYTKDRIAMLDGQINGKFKTVSFQLFEEQINGGISECCKVLVPGPGSLVRFESANNAARINAGLEIIDALAAHYGRSLPVFVDNAESVVKLVDVDTQVIRLVVSEADSQLRVVIND